jgi:hypothetical protein
VKIACKNNTSYKRNAQACQSSPIHVIQKIGVMKYKKMQIRAEHVLLLIVLSTLFSIKYGWQLTNLENENEFVFLKF